MLKNIFRKALPLGMGTVTQRVAVFASFVIVSRELGIEALGIYSFAFVMLQYVMIGQDMGLSNIGARQTALNVNNVPALVRIILAKRALLSVVSLLAGVGYVMYGPVPEEAKFFTIVLLLSNIPYVLSLDWILWGSEKFVLLGLWRAVVGVSYMAILAYGLIGFDLKIEAVVYANFISLILTVLVFSSYFSNKKYFKKQKKSIFDKKIINLETDWKNVFHLGVAIILNRSFHSIDVLMIVALLGTIASGLYNSAYRLLFIIFGVMYLILQVIYPGIVKEKINWKKLTKYAASLFIFGILIMVLLSVYAEELLFYIFDVSDDDAVEVLRYLALAVPFEFVVSLLGMLLIAWNKNRHNLAAILTATLVNIVLNLIMIPVYGVVGAAIVTLISYAFLMIFLIVVFVNIYKNKLYLEV